MLGPPKCSKHKSLGKPQKNEIKKNAFPKAKEHRNHGKSFLTICNSSISLPSVHTHAHTCAWYAKSACAAAASPPTLATNLAMNIFAQNGSRLQTVCLALHTSRRWRETFYLGKPWLNLSLSLDKRVSSRSTYASLTCCKKTFVLLQQFWQFFLLPPKKFRAGGNDRRQSVVHSFLGNLYSRMFLCCLIGSTKSGVSLPKPSKQFTALPACTSCQLVAAA